MEKAEEPEFLEIYTDGACSGNPGPGGWGAVMLYGKYEKRISGGEKDTTNNKMELFAAIQGLKSVTRNDIKIKVYTDSTYVLKGITEWISGWKKKNFKDVKNVELWKELDAISSKFSIEWNWVKAHNGNKYNEIADTLAREESLKFKT
jgi:ribonuclease HI